MPGADVRDAPAEALPFDDGRFDVVLAQLVVNFMRDARAGVREMARVARAGGTVAACVWDYAAGMSLLRAFWDAASALDPAAAARDEGHILRFTTPPELEALWHEAGLGDVATSRLTVRARYEDFDELWAPLELGVGPSGAYAASLPPADRAALRREMHARLGAPAGAFELAADAWSVIGRRAASHGP